jgi:P pilus assembly chaperone PapD
MQLSAGVLVAPTSVILSERKKTGRLTIQNPSDKPKEVTIGFSFGIPVSDSLGNIELNLSDSAVTDDRSALGWIRAFPRKVILEPGASQIIRFVARPPKDLPNGEYWCRVMVKSQAGETSIPVPDDTTKITTKLNMIMQTAIVLKYRTGNLVSKLEVTNSRVHREDSTVFAYISMANRGNVSYIGVLNTRLVDADGKELSRRKIDLAVYRELTRRMELPVTGTDFKSPLKVEVTISNEGRSDVPPEEMVVGNVIDYIAQVE